MHHLFHTRPVSVMLIATAPRRGEYIVMQIAIAQMTKAIDAVGTDPSQCCFALLNKGRNGAKRDRDIMRTDRPNPPVRFWDALTNMPEGITLGMGLCDDTIGDQTRRKRSGKDRFQRICGP